MTYLIQVSSAQGCRKVNADCWFVSIRLTQTSSEPHHEVTAIRSEKTVFMAVCDGVGDNLTGQSASKKAIEGMELFWNEFHGRETIPLDHLALKLANAGRAALPDRHATTLSLALVRGLHFCSLNIGDSPVFFISDLGSRELSRRDNLYFDKKRHKFHAEESGKRILTAHLGYGTPELKQGQFNGPGNSLLVCSDGLGFDSTPDGRILNDIPKLVSARAQYTGDNATALMLQTAK